MLQQRDIPIRVAVVLLEIPSEDKEEVYSSQYLMDSPCQDFNRSPFYIFYFDSLLCTVKSSLSNKKAEASNSRWERVSPGKRPFYCMAVGH